MGSNLKTDLADALKRKDYPRAIQLLEASSLPDRATRIAKLKERIAAERESSIGAQIDRAKALIQDGKWNEARGLLATIDDPIADKLLDRLDKINPVAGTRQTAPVIVQSDKSFTGKLVVCVVLLFILFIPGLIALAVFAGEAKRYPDAPGAGALIWLNRFMFWGFVVIAALAFVMLVMVKS